MGRARKVVFLVGHEPDVVAGDAAFDELAHHRARLVQIVHEANNGFGHEMSLLDLQQELLKQGRCQWDAQSPWIFASTITLRKRSMSDLSVRVSSSGPPVRATMP